MHVIYIVEVCQVDKLSQLKPGHKLKSDLDQLECNKSVTEPGKLANPTRQFVKVNLCS